MADGYWTRWIIFWVLGLLNNTPGVVVNSAAKSISEHFGKSDQIGLLYWSNTALGLVVSILAGSILLRFTTNTKMIVAFVCALAGITITAIAARVSFELAIVGILLIGTSSALGQATILGYGRFFDPKLVGGWSSGTGGAGIAGTGVYLLLKTVLKMSNLAIFCVFIPLSIIYYLCYLYLSLKLAPAELIDFAQQQQRNANSAPLLINYEGDSETYQNGQNGSSYALTDTSSISRRDKTQAHLDTMSSQYGMKNQKKGENVGLKNGGGDDLAVEFSNNNNNAGFLFDADSTDRFSHANGYGSLNTDNDQQNLDRLVQNQSKIEQVEFQKINEEFQEEQLRENWCSQFCRVWPKIWVRSTMLMLIYFLEYVIQSLFANHAAPKTDHSPTQWAYVNAYEVLSFCYQIGVFFSRSSIGCFQFNATWLLTLLQAINFTLWLCHAKLLFIEPYWLLFPAMVWVGVMAGLCYVNTFFSIQNDPTLGKDKEFAVNIVSIGINTGITMSSFFTLLADHTWLQKAKK